MINKCYLKDLILKNKYRHPFHIVTSSPWPLYASISIFSVVINFVMYLHFYSNAGLYFSLSLVFFLLVLFGWFNDIIFESTYQLKHTKLVQRGLRLGMLLFILSEVMFFFSFFWAFFHSSVAPAIQIGGIWPPKGIVVFNPWEIPLLNTVILLLSGVWATLGHNIIKFRQKKYYRVALIAFLVAIFLGILFTFVQFYEYATAPFSISDGIYGSTFFMTTGLHGVHVIVGTLFLIVITLRHHFKHFYHMEAVSVDAAVWYWHFVDVVWLFLFISIYWWGS